RRPRVCGLAGRAGAAGGGGPPVPPPVHLYVSNEDSNDVSIIDTKTDVVVATVPVGKRPRGLRLSRDGRMLLVALSGSPKPPHGREASALPADRSADGIGMVDLALGRVVRVLPSGQDPETFDLSPDGRTLYVANEETAEASLIDVASGKITRRVAVGGEPEGVATRPDGRVVYVTSELDNRVSVLDAKSGDLVAMAPTGTRPRAAAVSTDGKRAFVSAELGGTVTIVAAVRHVPVATIDLRPPQVAPSQVLPMPMGVTLSPDGRMLYVTAGRGRSLFVLDAASGRILRTIADVGARPWGVAVTPDGSKLYTAHGPSNDVSVLDAATLAIRRRIPVGRSPWGLAIDSAAR